MWDYTFTLPYEGIPLDTSRHARFIIECAGHDFSPDEYPVCGEMYQSPINIKTAKTVFASEYTNLTFKSYDSTPASVSFKLFNSGGHTGL